MKTILYGILMIVLLSALSEARVGTWVADLEDKTAGVTNGFSGVMVAYQTTIGQGHKNRPITFFGAVTISTTITSACLCTASGASIGALKWNNTVSKVNQFVYGKIVLNATSFALLQADALYITVSTAAFPKGAVKGNVLFGISQFVSFLTPSQVVGTTPSSSDLSAGIAVAIFQVINRPLPHDLVAFTAFVNANFRLTARIVHTVAKATTAGFYGPATVTTTNNSLVALTSAGLFSSFVDNSTFSSLSNRTTFGDDSVYAQVNSAAFPGGEIRGQLNPTLIRRRNEVPIAFNGTGTVVGNYSSLYHATKPGVVPHGGGIVSLVPASNGIFSGVFSFQLPASGINVAEIRQARTLINVKTTDGAGWVFSYFNLTSLGFDTYITFNGTSYTSGNVGNFENTFSSYIAPNGIIKVKVSTATTATGPLLLDQFCFVPFFPNAATNEIVRANVKNFQSIFDF